MNVFRTRLVGKTPRIVATATIAAFIFVGLGLRTNAADSPAYKHWPHTREWVDLTNHLWSSYVAISQRCEAAGVDMEYFYAPCYKYPMADYTRFARKIEELCPEYVCMTNADAEGNFDVFFSTTNKWADFPMWTVSNLLAYCNITNSLGQTNWYTNGVFTSWDLVSHTIQQQITTALTALVWTRESAGPSSWTNDTTGAYSWYGYGWDDAKTNDNYAYNPGYVGAWPQAFSESAHSGTMAGEYVDYYEEDWYEGYNSRSMPVGGTLYVSGTSRTNWFFKALIAASGQFYLTNDYCEALPAEWSWSIDWGTNGGGGSGTISSHGRQTVPWLLSPTYADELYGYMDGGSYPHIHMDGYETGGDPHDPGISMGVDHLQIDSVEYVDALVLGYRVSVAIGINASGAGIATNVACYRQLYLVGCIPEDLDYEEEYFQWDSEIEGLTTNCLKLLYSAGLSSNTNELFTNACRSEIPFDGETINQKGYQIKRGLWLLKWQFPTVHEPTNCVDTQTADCDRDDLVVIGASIESFGPDTGTILDRADQDEPYVVIPVAQAPAWYGGLPIHAYISQGGNTNLPFGYLTYVIPSSYYNMVYGIQDEDGYCTACSLFTKVLESGAITNAGCELKQASVLRPRGNLVAFEFDFNDDLANDFNAWGHPIGINSNRTYVLWDATPVCNTDLVYDLYFDSGIVHQYGPEGTITNVFHVDGRHAAVSSSSIPGASITFSPRPATAADSRYDVILTWTNDRVGSVKYCTKDGVITNTVTWTTNTQGWLNGMTKSALTNGNASIDFANQTISYAWGTVVRSEESNPRKVTLLTTVTDCGSESRTVKEEVTFNTTNQVTVYKATLDDNASTAAETKYEYQPDTGRYSANHTLTGAKLAGVIYPDGSAVTNMFDQQTGWLTNSVSPIGNGLYRSTAYDYDTHGGGDTGDEPNETNLVERPRSVSVTVGTSTRESQFYSYSGASRTVLQQSTNEAASWGSAGNVITTNNYSTNAGLLYGLLTSSVYSVGASSYSHSESGGKLTTAASHSSGETITNVVNGCGSTEQSILMKNGQTNYSAISTADSFGRILRTDYNDGTNDENLAYSLHGPTQVRERDGTTTAIVYYKTGWLKTITRSALNRATDYSYNAVGDRIEIVVTDHADTVEHSQVISV